MKLRIVENATFGIAVIDVETGEIFESGYENLKQAKQALKNFKEIWA